MTARQFGVKKIGLVVKIFKSRLRNKHFCPHRSGRIGRARGREPDRCTEEKCGRDIVGSGEYLVFEPLFYKQNITMTVEACQVLFMPIFAPQGRNP
jgi:hypothetical protein